MPLTSPTNDPVVFLNEIQDLLALSKFTSSYKFALLYVLCDVCQVRDESNLEVSLDEIARGFIDIYWNQEETFHPKGQPAITLSQWSGTKVSTAIRQIRDMKRRGRRKHEVMESDEGQALVGQVVKVLTKDVLVRLQTEREGFLYAYQPRIPSLHLREETVRHMRTLRPILVTLIEDAWLRWVENKNLAGSGTTLLRRHLFHFERLSVRKALGQLLELQDGKCFYTGKPLIESTAHVDHFLPFSRVHHDSTDNLVACKDDVNLEMSDKLKPPPQMLKWRDRNCRFASSLQRLATAVNLPWDPGRTHELTARLYPNDQIGRGPLIAADG